mmetsp:Transcript_64911/g.141464  ORF Transcript_64911/g.141464 Transcript_64911/m.141464 type:complete len:315 (+) Transcript_64911:829-1773(+)
MQKSRLVISSSFSCRSCATMSSMACFTRVNESRRAELAKATSSGRWTLAAAASSTAAARSRLAEVLELRFCMKDVGASRVLVKSSRASSVLRRSMALEIATISSCRNFFRFSHSSSVIVHFALSSMRKSLSAPRDAYVSSLSCLACTRFSPAVASCCFLSSNEAMPVLISASLALFRASKASRASISSFWESERSASKVSFIWFRMPKISPDCTLYSCLKVGAASRYPLGSSVSKLSMRLWCGEILPCSRALCFCICWRTVAMTSRSADPPPWCLARTIIAAFSALMDWIISFSSSVNASACFARIAFAVSSDC